MVAALSLFHGHKETTLEQIDFSKLRKLINGGKLFADFTMKSSHSLPVNFLFYIKTFLLIFCE